MTGRAAAVVLSLLAALAAPTAVLSESAAPAQWTRAYPIPAFAEIWRLELEVPSVQKARAKAIAILEKQRGEPAVPVANMASSSVEPFQQLSYRLPASRAKAALKRLQGLGAVKDLRKSPGIDPAVGGEVRAKLETLNAERTANAAALEKMPSIRAAAAEIAAHLEEVARAERAAADRVLLNLELRERAPKR